MSCVKKFYHLSLEKLSSGQVLNKHPECLTSEPAHDWIENDVTVTGIFMTDYKHIRQWRKWLNLKCVTCYVYEVRPLGEVVKIILEEPQPPEWFSIGGAVEVRLYGTIKPEQYPLQQIFLEELPIASWS